MPVTVSEEHGVKIETQSCDVFCMPPKKRHLHRFQSMTTITQPLDFPLSGTQPQHILSLKESEYVLNPQMAFPGEMPEKSLAEVKEGLSNNSQDSVVDNLPDFPQESPSISGTMASATVIDRGKFDVNDKKLDGGDKSQLASGETDMQSAFRESNQPSIVRNMGERIPSDKSAFRKVEDIISNDGSFALPAQSHDYNGNIVKQEGLDTSLGDTGLPKGPMLVHCKVEEADSAQLQSNRSNWDLNTVMDSWEGSLAIASGSYGEGGKCSQVFSDVGKNEIKNLDGIGTPLCEHFHPDAYLNLELSSPGTSNSHFKLRMPCHLPLASSCNNVSNLRLSSKPLTTSGHPNFSLNNSIKPEPYSDFGQGGGSHFEAIPISLVYKSIKPEPCEEVVKQCSSFLLPRNPEVGQDMACILAANLESKLETWNCDSLRGTCIMDGEASLTMPADENVRDGSNENANSLSDFTSADRIADCSNHHSYQVQFSSVHCASQVTIPTESNLEPVSNSKVSINDELTRNSSSGELIKNSVAANCPGASETVCQTNYMSLDSALPIIGNSQVITSAVPPAALEETSNVGEKQDMDSEVTVTIPSKLKSLDQDVSESTTGVSNVDCELASVCTRPAVATNALDSSVQISNFDDSTSLSSGFALLEKSNADMNEYEVVPNADETSQMREEPHVHENQGGLQSMVATFQLKAKHHMDDVDDIEDGEVRELNVQPGAISSLCDGKETNQMCCKEPGSLVNPVALPSPSSLKGEVEIRTQNQENAHSSSEFSGNICGKDIITGADSLVDVQNPTFEAGRDSDLSKSKPVKTSRKLCRDELSKEKCNETKQCSKSSSGNNKALVDDGMGEVGSHTVEARGSKLLPADHSCPSKLGLSEKVNDNTNVQSRGSRSRIAHLIPDFKDSAVMEKSTEKKHLPSQIERERSSDMSIRGDAPYRRGNRNECCANELKKFEKGSKKEETFNNKVENDFARSRGRIDKQLETLHGDQNADADYALERFGRSNSYRFLKSRNASDVGFPGVDDSIESTSRTIRNPPMAEGLDTFSRVSRRRRSPGTRERPMNVGVQIIRRPMRDVSPGRCADGVSNLLLLGHEERFMQRMSGDGVDPSAISGTHSNFERKETFIQRGRSVSPPLLRRGASRLTRMHSPSSTRRVRSPRQWSPQRSLDGFNVRREAVRGRSPSLQVVRMRSPPNPRDCYMEGVPGRRCGSPPCIPRLRDDIRDVGPPREFEYVRSGAPIQRNMRRLRLIDARVNGEEYFGPVNSRTRIHELLEDESLGDRRGGGERHGIIRPLRHRYGDASEEDLDFQIEPEGHRPIRFRMGDEEEFPDRGRPRGGGIRSRLGELSRRLRSVEERDDDRAWHDADFDDARTKRRRF